MKGKALFLIILSCFLEIEISLACEGKFVNPFTDICWQCLYPLSIGSINLVSTSMPDTRNPIIPMEVCLKNAIPRTGLNIGYWEPFALVDVTADPYCMVNLGGFKIDIGNAGHGAGRNMRAESRAAFYHVHWYKYPVMMWLNILTSAGCFHGGDFDIGYLSELDPTWNDDELGFIFNPEVVLFSNSAAQTSCSIDAVKSSFGLPIDLMFWCAGSHGSMYPLTGNVNNDISPINTAVLLAERMDFKLHREFLIQDSSGDAGTGVNGPICDQHLRLIMPKSRYRYQMTNPVAVTERCYPFGHNVHGWEMRKIPVNNSGCFGFIIWKKRNCVFL